MKTKIFIVASENIESTKVFTNSILAKSYYVAIITKGEKAELKEQEIEVPFATDRRKYGMSLNEIRDEIAAFTGDRKGEAMRKAKIFAHNISIKNVINIKLSFGSYSKTENGKVVYYGENRNYLCFRWTDKDGDSDFFSIIE